MAAGFTCGVLGLLAPALVAWCWWRQLVRARAEVADDQAIEDYERRVADAEEVLARACADSRGTQG